MNHILLLAIIMAGFGFLGGIVNYVYGNSRSERKVLGCIDFNLLKSVFTGIAASFLVPLFLNMMSSNIMRESETNPFALFVFCGFCTIASISSKAFINAISSRILEKVNRVEEDMEAVKYQLYPVVLDHTELDEEPNGNGGEHGADRIETDRAASDKDSMERLKVLSGLSCSNYTFRSINGLSRETGIDAPNVKAILEDFTAKGLAGKVIREQNTRYYITENGRRHLSGLNPIASTYCRELKSR